MSTQTEPQMRADAVAAVMAMDNPAPAEAAPVAQSEPETVNDQAPSADGADGAEYEQPEGQSLDADGAETPTEGDDAEGQATVAADPPQFWPDEAKSDFANLSPEAQTALTEHYKTAQTQINAKFEEAAAVRKEATAKVEALSAISVKVEEALKQATDTFKGRWDGMTDQLWLQLSRENPQEYIQYRAQYDAEQNALQQAQAAKDAAARVERQEWLKAQAEELKTLAPELTDPKEGKQRFEKTIAYLVSRGAKEQDLDGVSAAVMALAYDSMQLQELRKSGAKPVAKPVPKAGLSPSTAAPAAIPQQQRVQQLQNRLNQTADRGDAVALLMAKGII